MMKEVKEMLYLFERTVILDDSKVRKLFPDFKETPMDEAITETLSWFKNQSAIMNKQLTREIYSFLR